MFCVWAWMSAEHLIPSLMQELLHHIGQKLLSLLSLLHCKLILCCFCLVSTLGCPVSADAPPAVLWPAGRFWRHQLLPPGQDDLLEDPVLCQQSGGEPEPDQIHSLPLQRPAYLVETVKTLHAHPANPLFTRIANSHCFKTTLHVCSHFQQYNPTIKS